MQFFRDGHENSCSQFVFMKRVVQSRIEGQNLPFNIEEVHPTVDECHGKSQHVIVTISGGNPLSEPPLEIVE